MSPIDIDQIMQTAYGYHQAGQRAPAESLYRQILDQHPGHEGALRLLYLLASQNNRPDLAIEYLRRAAIAQPNNPTFCGALGDVLLSQGQLDEAAACYRRLLELKPDASHAYNNLGAALLGQGKRDEAIACYRRAAALNPRDAAILNNLGEALCAQGKLDEAMGFVLGALELRPDFAAAHNNLGAVFLRLGKLDEAAACFRRALQEAPRDAKALSNLGSALFGQGKLDEAERCLDEAIRLNPQFGAAHAVRASIWLLRGDLERGWAEHEWRWHSALAAPRRRTFQQPLWDGSPLQGRTILLYWEQGFGDTLQFIRYAPLVAQCGGPVVVECQAPLKRLLRNSLGNVTLVDELTPLPPFDVQCPLLSLPFLFRTTLPTIPRHVPYVAADAESIAHWRSKLANEGDVLKVGVTWAGNKDQTNDYNRSMPLDALAPLGQVPAVRFYSLQKGDRSLQASAAAPAKLPMIDWTEELRDFADTAGLIANLDLVISVCTSIAHLTGAMGKPVWTLLAFVPDWRWLLGREDSPWYPSMQLFRQPAAGDWASVTQRVADALRQKSVAHRA